MKNFILFTLVCVFIVSGCSQNDDTQFPVYEGTVVYKTNENNTYRFFVLETITDEELNNGTLGDFLTLAGNQPEASYYTVDKETYDSVDTGQRVRITADTDQLESQPPIRAVKEIEIIK